MKVIPGDCLIDIKAVSTRLGVSVSTVKRLRRQGDLPPSGRVGRSIRWRSSDIDSYVGRLVRAPDYGSQ
jgi:predicted DNA-binding transcriptional regulator AlpA